jgi:ABC-type spermidine/putrescine transport system permease subunit II
VTLPLTLPGIAAGAVFVFVLSIGNFVTPALLGGGRFQMIGNLVYDQFLAANDWPFGAALDGADCHHDDPPHAAGAGDGRLAGGEKAAGGADGMSALPPPRSGAASCRHVFGFLYIPIAVLVALSFNEGGLPTVWSGFSIKWYVSLVQNAQILRRAGTR